MTMPEAVTDTQYREMLLEQLGVGDPADPANDKSIDDLEEMLLDTGSQLPIIRRIGYVPQEPIDLNDPNAPATWAETDKGIEFFDEPKPE